MIAPRTNFRLRHAGVFVAGVLAGAGYVLGGCVDRHVLLLAPVLVAGPLAAFGWGVRAGPGRRLLRAGAWVAVWLTGLALPPAVRYGQVYSETRRLIPPDAEIVLRRIDVVVGDPTPDYLVGYETALPLGEACQARSGMLTAAGWRPTRPAPFVPGDFVTPPSRPVEVPHVSAEAIALIRSSIHFDAAESENLIGGRLYSCVCDDGTRRQVYFWPVPEPW